MGSPCLAIRVKKTRRALGGRSGWRQAGVQRMCQATPPFSCGFGMTAAIPAGMKNSEK
jgi:hypothetical protein